jgi:Carbohydrate-binding module family 5/12
MSEPFWSALGAPAGAGAVDYEGAWAAGTSYLAGDVVIYNGVTYLAVNPSLGVAPGGGVGVASIASTVAGLGVVADGRVAILRCGSGVTAHDLIVVYDATLGKWVSDVFVTGLGIGRSSGQGAAGNGYAEQGVVSGMGGIPWRIFDAAGMKPQLRQLGYGAVTGSGITMNRFYYYGADLNASVVAGAGIPSTEVQYPDATARQRDSGWGDIPAGWTVKDVIKIYQQITNTTGGGGGIIDTPTGMLRWVSQ